MEKIQRIEKNFTQKRLVEIMAKYELYYQITLGELLKQNAFDKKDLELKVTKLNLQSQPQNVLNTMIEIINSFYNEKNFNEIFLDNIKINAMIHALKDFTQEDKDLKNKDIVYKEYSKKIMDETFFDLKNEIHFSDELKHRIEFWNPLITQESAEQLKISALKMI